ncbi:hypothetical protein BBA70_02190 [New Jersey aster yellows phytoplasma]|uniref:Uncharacterized protein n=1 Tax=New Jersey aster yellows phytoplasma TaxID=270520 RepID=A0ABX4K239_9MOLU|nr:hypothetical protein BBA70_02190 [New Jersey aster yellows phytoplasma]
MRQKKRYLLLNFATPTKNTLFFSIKKQNTFQLILKKGKIYMCLFIKQFKKDENIFLNNKNNKINLIFNNK